MADRREFPKRTKTVAELKQTNPVAVTLFIVVLAPGILASALSG